MKIAIVTHNVIKGDGQGRVNFEITRHALQEGHSVTLLANQVDTALVDQGAHWIPLHPQFMNQIDLFLCAEFAHKANKIVQETPEIRDADIIHGFGHSLSVPHHINTAQFVHSAWMKSPMHSSKLSRDLNSAYQWTFTRLNADWEKKAFAQAKRVVAASPAVYQELRDIGIEENRLEVIYNGVDITEFKPEPKTSRSQYNLPDGSKTLAFFAGDIRSARKNLDSVLRAMVPVAELHLGVIGRLQGSPYPALAESLGIADRVHFLDYRRDVGEIMRSGDFFVFPSRYEPFGNVVLEAMASGLPVVTSANVGAACVVTPESGIVIEGSDNIEALTQAMKAMTENPDRRKEMSENAVQEAMKYTWDKIASRYLELYKEVAGN